MCEKITSPPLPPLKLRHLLKRATLLDKLAWGTEFKFKVMIMNASQLMKHVYTHIRYNILKPFFVQLLIVKLLIVMQCTPTLPTCI